MALKLRNESSGPGNANRLRRRRRGAAVPVKKAGGLTCRRPEFDGWYDIARSVPVRFPIRRRNWKLHDRLRPASASSLARWQGGSPLRGGVPVLTSERHLLSRGEEATYTRFCDNCERGLVPAEEESLCSLDRFLFFASSHC